MEFGLLFQMACLCNYTTHCASQDVMDKIVHTTYFSNFLLCNHVEKRQNFYLWTLKNTSLLFVRFPRFTAVGKVIFTCQWNTLWSAASLDGSTRSIYEWMNEWACLSNPESSGQSWVLLFASSSIWCNWEHLNISKSWLTVPIINVFYSSTLPLLNLWCFGKACP